MTNVLTDKQKKISNEVGLTLQHAAVVAQLLVGLGHHSDALITTINAALERLERVGSEVAEPIADTQQATDAECVTGCDGPDNPEWRRARAMELAITANQGRHIDAVMAAAKQIETFLKRGA